MIEFSKEEKELRALAKDFAEKELSPYAKEHDDQESFNLKAFKKMGQLGLFGITADSEYGGSGLGQVASTIIMEELGKVCASTTLSYLAHTILCVNNIDKNASKKQKEEFLPKLISGEWIGAMGMSEPDFGSDAVGIQTRATQLNSGDFEISGSKMWITNAQYADIVFLYARTGTDKKNISSFIVSKGTKGFSVGKSIEKMGMRASPTGELVFEKAIVSKDRLVGNMGDSVHHMMKNLEIERTTISGISLGLAKACYDVCHRYVQERKQFGKYLCEFQMIQEKMALMSAKIEMMDCFLYSITRSLDLGQSTVEGAAKVKLLLPQMTTAIALDAIQILGGYGYSREFPVERFLRDAKLMEIGAGTNEVMILILAKALFPCLKNK